MDAFEIERGSGPVVLAAIHDGHAVRDEVRPFLALGEAERLREEDPFTARWTQPEGGNTDRVSRIVGRRSRFEVDLNRPRETCVYLAPSDAWGLTVWDPPLSENLAEASRAIHDDFYLQVGRLLNEVVRRHGRALVFDLHSYNHRRDGADALPADPEANPELNLGTGTMDRGRWASVVDRFVAEAAGRSETCLGWRLDVRENIKFRGGYFGRWVHERFPESVCVLSIEFKKFFMDEWTGAPNNERVGGIGKLIGELAARAESWL